MSVKLTPSAEPSAPVVRADLYSHNVKFTGFDDHIKSLFVRFCYSLAFYGLERIGPGRFAKVIKGVYVATTHDRSEFHFHINQYQEVLSHLDRFGITASQIQLVQHLPSMGEPVTFENESLPEPRDYQIPQIEYMVAPGSIKVATLQTGRGKSLLLMKAIVTLAVRTALVIKGMYVDKWIEDVEKGLGLKKGELLVVRGSKDLKNLIALGAAGEITAKFIIITNKTIYNYLKEYERFYSEFDKLYDCKPEDLYMTLGVGIRAIDEVHQEFHGNFRQDLYTNVAKTISMSATLEHDDSFMTKMYEVNFPHAIRPPRVEYDKYILVLGIQYRFDSIRHVRYMGANNMYSHMKLEQTIMRRKDILGRYLGMIAELVGLYFCDDNWEPGQKMIVYGATVEFVTLMGEHLANRYPSFKVGRYTAEDEYTVLFNNDIICSTLKSAGTAVDVPGLREVLMTDAVNSRQANVQALGRLRRMKDWPDRTPRFIYIYADNIERHRAYSDEKKEKLAGRVLAHKMLMSPYHI
jgi:hypothetical protein